MFDMAAEVDHRRAHFTFIWAIENASNIQSSKSFRSPIFSTDSEVMEKTSWHLTLDRGIYSTGFFIRRAEVDGGPDTIEIDYEISLLSIERYPLVKMMDRKRFKNSSIFALRRFVSSDEVFNERKDKFLPKDTLTVQCRIWKTTSAVPSGDLQYVRTRKRINRISFVWAIKNFSTLLGTERRIHIVNPTTKMAPKLILTFYLQESLGKEYAFFHCSKDAESNCHFIYGKVCIIDVNGRAHHTIEAREYDSLGEDSNWLCKLAYPKHQIIANKESLLPNDMLTFKCIFEIETEPFCFQTETYKDFISSDLEYIVSAVPEIEYNDTPDVSPLQTFLTDCLKIGTLSDVCLRTGSESFPVHRLILSIFSPVFKAMFTKDIQEEDRKYIDIPDVDADTLRLMLSYIYTNTVPSHGWERSAQLLIAANKYELVDLEEKCTEFLTSNLTASNCFSILKIADSHHDQSLQTVVYRFMIKHNTEVFKSDAWKNFKKENFDLAMNTTERIICLMKNKED
ncbi:Speckle-type POZ protein B like protein [Argiope bruennichi]|uniref:Speckle-type POZ protein B like protein n=1 Tax=Argiope bruennichi TaxID=94029 RepID=A0A8T0EFE5_ARGBR|nr:Speckle-type POZ protein B like protein [Argiope bruennichi]